MDILLIYFKNLNKLAVFTYFLAFKKISLLDLDPGPGEKLNADPDPQPW